MREYVDRNGYEDVFDRVRADRRQSLPKQGVWEHPRSRGIGFQLTEPDNSRDWTTYIGLQAGKGGSAFSVSTLPRAIRWDEDSFGRLRRSVDLSEWPHGGFAFAFASEAEWAKLRPALLEFVNAVMASRSSAGEDGT